MAQQRWGYKMGKLIRRLKKTGVPSVRKQAQSADKSNANNANARTGQPQETPEQKALRLASAVTNNGRQTAQIDNNTTNIPVTSETVNDKILQQYVGDVHNRASRRKRGAPMANDNGTLGQPTILGV